MDIADDEREAYERTENELNPVEIQGPETIAELAPAT